LKPRALKMDVNGAALADAGHGPVSAGRSRCGTMSPCMGTRNAGSERADASSPRSTNVEGLGVTGRPYVDAGERQAEAGCPERRPAGARVRGISCLVSRLQKRRGYVMSARRLWRAEVLVPVHAVGDWVSNPPSGAQISMTGEESSLQWKQRWRHCGVFGAVELDVAMTSSGISVLVGEGDGSETWGEPCGGSRDYCQPVGFRVSRCEPRQIGGRPRSTRRGRGPRVARRADLASLSVSLREHFTWSKAGIVMAAEDFCGYLWPGVCSRSNSIFKRTGLAFLREDFRR